MKGGGRGHCVEPVVGSGGLGSVSGVVAEVLE